jgi:hypothetical protein
LGEIGNKCPAVLPECVSIIKAYLHDIDSEVRERANFYWNLLAGSEVHKAAYNDEIFDLRFIESAQELIKAGLESDSPMDYQKVFAEGQSKASQSLSPAQVHALCQPGRGQCRPDSEFSSRKAGCFWSVSKEALQFFKQHEDFSEYGDLKLVSKTIVASGVTKELSAKEADFYVRLTKYFFEENIILEYSITNQDEQHVAMASLRTSVQSRSTTPSIRTTCKSTISLRTSKYRTERRAKFSCRSRRIRR